MEFTAHAYVSQGSADSVTKVHELLKKAGYETEGNPDLYVHAYAWFTIDDARTLRERASLRAVGKGGRIFVISAPTIASDAQNALLKTFEEPPAGAKFFLIVPSPEILLPTLLSRMQRLELSDRAPSAAVVDVRKFLKSDPEVRLKMLEPFLEKGEDDRRDLAGTIEFLTQVERALADKPRENEVGLRATYRARKYITDRGALAKTLLEQAALLIPKM